MLDRELYEKQLQELREKQVDEISNYLKEYLKLSAHIREMKPFEKLSEENSQKIIDTPISRKGRPMKEVADELVENVFSKSMSLQHPKFFSFVTSGVSPYSLAGSVLSDIYNVNAAGYSLAPGTSLIEEKMIRWMGSLAGFDENCGGIFTSGGSLSNLTGMIAARENMLTEDEYAIGVAYTSDQTHSSVRKGLKLMGLRSDQIKIIESDDEYKIRLDLLEEAIKEDIAAGKKPFLVIASLGSTNTGAIDSLESVSIIKEKYNMWMHVDGAYGGSILLSDIYRNYAKGIENADSFSWDLHKWAMQTYSCSCVIAKNKKTFVTTFAEHPEYLSDIIEADHTDGWDLGIEMSRPSRVIKWWFTVQAMGTDLLSDVVDYAFFNANVAKKEILKRKDWRIVSQPMCGAICFRYEPKDIDSKYYDEINTKITELINERKLAYIVTTVLRGMRVVRLCLINGNTTDKDVIEVVSYLDDIAKEVKEQYENTI